MVTSDHDHLSLLFLQCLNKDRRATGSWFAFTGAHQCGA